MNKSTKKKVKSVCPNCIHRGQDYDGGVLKYYCRIQRDERGHPLEVSANRVCKCFEERIELTIKELNRRRK